MAIARPEPRPTPPRVLVIEDNPDTADAMVMLLQLHGYEAHAANDGREGVAMATQMAPHFVVVHQELPAPHGAEIARHLHALEVQPVVIGTSTHDSAAGEAPAHGFDRRVPDDLFQVLKVLQEEWAGRFASAG